MTLQTFIHDTLPDLASMLHNQDCDHVLISDSGSWHARISGSWHVQTGSLSPETLSILVEMCVETPDANLVPPFAIHILEHPQHTSLALTRQHPIGSLTLPDPMREMLTRAIAQGNNGVIIGPPSAPKELLLAALAATQTSPCLYISARAPSSLPPHALLIAPPSSPRARRHVRETMRVIDAAFWEDVHAPSHLDSLWSYPGCQRRWCTMDGADPEAALEAIAAQSLLLPTHTLHHIVWVEPFYHSEVPPIVLERHQDMWRTSSTSALASFLVEQANRHLPLTPHELEPPKVIEPLESLTHIDASSLTLSIDSEPDHLEVDRSGFSELLQTHVTPDNHLLSTHPGFGSRSIQEDSDAGIVLPLASTPQPELPEYVPPEPEAAFEPAAAFEPEHVLSLDDISDEPVMFEELIDDEPDIIDESDASQLAYDPNELPHDPLAVTFALPPESDDSPTMTSLNELPEDVGMDDHEDVEEMLVDATVPISRDMLSAHYGELMNPLDEHGDDDDDTRLVPAPYDELKRMERELMTASHDEPTGIHPDFLDPPPAPREFNEDEVSTSVKGTTDMSLPDDPEVFSSLNSPPQPPRQLPAAPDGVWQPAIADEPTQISFEHTNFATPQPAEAPSLSWGDDEHTIQRKKNESALQTDPPALSGATDTSSKLSTLSDRIKALREKQRLSGQFEAIPHDEEM